MIELHPLKYKLQTAMSRYFMWIIFMADDSHKMSRFVFYKKKKKNLKKQNCHLLQLQFALLGSIISIKMLYLYSCFPSQVPEIVS